MGKLGNMMGPEARREQGTKLHAMWEERLAEDPARLIGETVISLNVPGCRNLGYPLPSVMKWLVDVKPTIRQGMIDAAAKPAESAFRFRLGSMGSIWFDVERLEGSGVTKHARMNLMGNVKAGGSTVDDVESFRIIVDPTFEEKWQ